LIPNTGISVAALLTLLTDEGEQLFKELLQGAKDTLPASTPTTAVAANAAVVPPALNSDGTTLLEVPPTEQPAPAQESSKHKAKRSGSKKKSFLSKLGKIVRLITKAISILFTQVTCEVFKKDCILTCALTRITFFALYLD
jgi:hypothetical protein